MKKTHWEQVQDLFEKSHMRRRPTIPAFPEKGLAEQLALGRLYLLQKIYPELVRDPAAFQKAILDSTLPGNQISPAFVAGDTPPPGVNGTVFRSVGELSMYSLFVQGGEKIYKLAREFGEQLSKVNLEISPHHLAPLGKVICIEFPDHMRFYDSANDDYFHCAYIGVDLAREGSMQDTEGFWVHKFVKIVFPCYTASGEIKPESNMFHLNLRKEETTIEESMVRARKYSSHPINDEGVHRYLLKAYVYLQSGDPDLRNYRAPRIPPTNKSKKLKRWFKEHENHSLVDMTLVGYDFKKPRVYQVGEVQVTGHFRWQPYGPKTDPKVKLIWIEPFVRNYKTEEEEK